jgi:hypothetical protein
MALRYALHYVVQCKSLYVFYEDIAAFNVESIAVEYASECGKANPQWQYRVIDRSRRGVIIHPKQPERQWTHKSHLTN